MGSGTGRLKLDLLGWGEYRFRSFTLFFLRQEGQDVRIRYEDRTPSGWRSRPGRTRGCSILIPGKRVISMPRLGGVHHRYDLAA